nr:MAG TPA: hypothetical protein [Caudoviricetes sp.]
MLSISLKSVWCNVLSFDHELSIANKAAYVNKQ